VVERSLLLGDSVLAAVLLGGAGKQKFPDGPVSVDSPRLSMCIFQTSAERSAIAEDERASF
jgi:hypothetical protein